jgi:predicted nucleic acid-binding Zn ribbon protein
VTTWRGLRPSAADCDPRPISDLLDAVTGGLGAPRAQVLSAVFAHWTRLVGPEIAAHAQPRSLRQGVLVVGADQPAWATQLRYLASDLLTRIRAETATEEISQIRITVEAPSARKRPPDDPFGGG